MWKARWSASPSKRPSFSEALQRLKAAPVGSPADIRPRIEDLEKEEYKFRTEDTGRHYVTTSSRPMAFLTRNPRTAPSS